MFRTIFLLCKLLLQIQDHFLLSPQTGRNAPTSVFCPHIVIIHCRQWGNPRLVFLFPRVKRNREGGDCGRTHLYVILSCRKLPPFSLDLSLHCTFTSQAFPLENLLTIHFEAFYVSQKGFSTFCFSLYPLLADLVIISPLSLFCSLFFLSFRLFG